jgi:hypothetical protein
MRYLKYAGLLGLFILIAGGSAFAQRVRIGVGIGVGVGPAYAGPYIGPPPVCRYGYYGYYPYACAPYGYYGPEYFANGVFIGAGPWFRGSYGPGYGYGYRRFDRDHNRFRGGEFHGNRGFDGGRSGFRGNGGSHGRGGFHGGGHGRR